jgi:excisionase family DNA binding protein
MLTQEGINTRNKNEWSIDSGMKRLNQAYTSCRPAEKEQRSMNVDKTAFVKAPDRVHYKVSEAARYLGISANTLRKYTDLGYIQAKRLPGGDRLYRRKWLDRFVQNLPDATEAN